IGHGVLRVVVIKQSPDVFAGKTAPEQIGDEIARERTKIETRTVEWIDETGPVPNRGQAIPTNLFAPKWQRGKSVNVAFDRLRLTEDGAPDWMRNQMIVQTLSQSCAGGGGENSAYVKDTRSDIRRAR